MRRRRSGSSPAAAGYFERLIPVPTRPGSYMLAEELILHYLPSVFSKYKVTEKSIIRVTRNADIDADPDV